jgi:hypothetical protein
MQNTPEILRQFAETFVEDRTKDDFSILAVYLTGSILSKRDPFIGGTTDIDLVFIHIGDPETDGEIVALNENIHYDILHHPQRRYLDRISLRIDPEMGPMLSEALVLYDPQHFMDLTQASVRGLFHRPENILQRAEAQSKSARKKWLDIQPPPDSPGPSEFLAYFSILEAAANSISLLSGETLSERRFLTDFQEYAHRIDKPGLYPGLLGMLGAPEIKPDILQTWVTKWESTYLSLREDYASQRLHPNRLNYYLKAFSSILESNQPKDILWPLIKTWTLAASELTPTEPGYRSWEEILTTLRLGGDGFAERIQALDALLDQVEDIINTWEFSGNS